MSEEEKQEPETKATQYSEDKGPDTPEEILLLRQIVKLLEGKNDVSISQPSTDNQPQ